jgi:hypothetical protein
MKNKDFNFLCNDFYQFFLYLLDESTSTKLALRILIGDLIQVGLYI